jgi:hypothetical protein
MIPEAGAMPKFRRRKTGFLAKDGAEISGGSKAQFECQALDFIIGFGQAFTRGVDLDSQEIPADGFADILLEDLVELMPAQSRMFGNGFDIYSFTVMLVNERDCPVRWRMMARQ